MSVVLYLALIALIIISLMITFGGNFIAGLILLLVGSVVIGIIRLVLVENRYNKIEGHLRNTSESVSYLKWQNAGLDR